MTPLYESFVSSVGLAGNNVIIMFVSVALAVLTWHALIYLPASWQTNARLAAWAWAFMFLGATIIYSI